MSSKIDLPFTEGDTILELGGGSNPFRIDGIKVINVDKRAVAGVDIIRDLETDFSDIGQYDGLFAQYLAEHIKWINVPTLFKSCFNVLKAGKSAVFIVPNLLEQAKILVGKEDWGSSDICMVFGGQDYLDNTHKTGWSPKYITKQLQDAGFYKVEISPLPSWIGDMVVIATKASVIAEVDTKMGGYDRSYFDGRVYVGEGYRDFPVNYKTVEMILAKKPTSVVEFGGARGYVCKKLEYHGIPTACVDVSEHCYHTRATSNFILHDTTTGSLDIQPNNIDLKYDLCFSKAYLEHIPEDKIDFVIRKMIGVSKRGYHGITFTITPNDVDDTHRLGTMRPKEWWIQKFKDIDPSYDVEIVDKEDLECKPYSIPSDAKGLNKLNLGSFTCMFHYGWVNVDIADLTQWSNNNAYRFIRHDLTTTMPLSNNEVDLITMHHLLECLTREAGLNLLRECYRVMKPGATMRVSTPDLRIMCKELDMFKTVYTPLSLEVEKATDNADAFFRLAIGGQTTMYDEDALVQALDSAGFKTERSQFNKSTNPTILSETIDSFPTISCYVDATKPISQSTDKLGEYLNG